MCIRDRFSASESARAQLGSASSAAEASKYGADRSVDTARINTEGTLANTRETGAQTRETMREENRLKAKTRATNRGYARSTARAF